MSQNLFLRSAKRIVSSSNPAVSAFRFSTPITRSFHLTSPRMVVKQIHNKQEWDALVAEGKPVLVDFFAVWCGPCRVISPVFEKFSDDASFAGLNFAKVDVDENPELSQEFGITAMPTFILVKNGIKEGEVRGANPPALQALVQKGAA